MYDQKLFPSQGEKTPLICKKLIKIITVEDSKNLSDP